MIGSHSTSRGSLSAERLEVGRERWLLSGTFTSRYEKKVATHDSESAPGGEGEALSVDDFNLLYSIVNIEGEGVALQVVPLHEDLEEVVNRFRILCSGNRLCLLPVAKDFDQANRASAKF